MMLRSVLAPAVGVFCVAAAAAVLQSQAPQGGPGRQGGRGQQAAALPDGEGRALVEGSCAACHGVNLITNSAGYTKEKWRELAATMIALPEAQAETMSQYLAAHFPPKPGFAPVLVPGPVTVTFKEWMVPTLGQRSRDPLQTPDGTIWWAGQYGNVVGRLNPDTGEMKEYKLPAGARPHSVIDDRSGNIWYMGNANATIGRLNPSTGEITVYPMPDPAARDPHTPIFDRSGTLWFTLQQSNMVGRLTPATGEIKLVTLPTARALPYGIDVDSQGVPWVAYNGSYKVASLDPITMAVREHVLPDQRTTVRRLAVAADDKVWYVNSSLGRLGRLDPKTGEVKEWPSPSGPDSHPYAIAIAGDAIWYNESRRRPDTLVRFDPKTETFQSWAVPSGVGTLRHMRVSPTGNLLIHQTSTNRIGLVTIGRPAAGTTSSQ
jgi:virginiamycin B lyase